MVKNPPVSAGDARDMGSMPGSRRFPGVGNGNSLQYSCLKNSIDGGAWQARIHGVTESNTTEQLRTTVCHTEPCPFLVQSVTEAARDKTRIVYPHVNCSILAGKG